MKNKWKRREFLRNTAIAGLLAPVAYAWRDLPEARAQVEKRNMVLIFLPNGKVHENPFVSRSGGSFSFDDGFRPYNAFRDRVIAFEEYGFYEMISAHYDGDHAGHVGVGSAMFSGEVAAQEGGHGSGGLAPTIDQIVAWDYLNRGVIENPLRKSLNIKITGSSFRTPSVFFQTPAGYRLNQTYRSAVPQVSPTESPRDGFAQMFGDLATMAGTTIEDLWAQGKSILDVPHRELGRLRTDLPSSGQAILDQHMHHLRELEIGLQLEGAEDPFEPPPAPTDMALSPNNHERILRQWWDVIDAALRLDRTRIVTLQFGGVASRFHVPVLGLGDVGVGDSNSGSDHHSYTHHDGARVPLFMNWYAERISELLTEMTGTGETSKPDILSDSAVMVGMEFGRNHRAVDVPVTLFGECGGYFDTGKVVTYGNDLGSVHKHTGTLLSVAHAMGTTGREKVGHDRPEYQRGSVPELLA